MTATPNTYRRMLATLNGRSSRKIANNTYLTREPDPESCVIRLHGHAIVRATPNGAVTIDQCGWPTLTTRDRINAAFCTYADNLPTTDRGLALFGSSGRSPYRIAAVRRVTTLQTPGRGGWTTLGVVPICGPVTIGPRGAIRGLQTTSRTRSDARRRALIADYARELQTRLPLPLPDKGDCWFCYMIDGAASPGRLPEHLSSDHLLSHISAAERYFVPSLVWNALLYHGCSPDGVGSAYFHAAFGELDGYPRERVVTMVRRYLERCLGVA